MNKFANIFVFKPARAGLSRAVQVSTETKTELILCSDYEEKKKELIEDIRRTTREPYNQYLLSDGSTILINKRRL